MLQVVAGVAGSRQRVMEKAHTLGRQNVDRVLILEGALLEAENKAELFNVIR